MWIYTGKITVNAFSASLYTDTGLSPAEFPGRDEKCFEFMLEYLRQRNVVYMKSSEKRESDNG